MQSYAVATTTSLCLVELCDRVENLKAQLAQTPNDPRHTNELRSLAGLDIDPNVIMSKNLSLPTMRRYMNRPPFLAKHIERSFGIAVRLTNAFTAMDQNDVSAFVRIRKTPTLADVRTWPVQFVSDWLTRSGLGHLCQWFAAQDIDGVTLMALNFDDVIALDSSFLDLVESSLPTLLSAIAALRASGLSKIVSAA